MIKKGSLTYYLLLALEKGIEAGTPLVDFLADPHTFVWTGYRTNLNYSNLYKTVRQLRINGYIETPKDGKNILLKLTAKGRQEVVLKKLLEDDSWDGKWRIVIFDIPEKHRHLRDTFRIQLRQFQFTPWQKSVWAGRKNVTYELRKFVKDVGLSPWVKILETTETP